MKKQSFETKVELDNSHDMFKPNMFANGLMDGEIVASNGVFKIDASAQLAGKKYDESRCRS